MKTKEEKIEFIEKELANNNLSFKSKLIDLGLNLSKNCNISVQSNYVNIGVKCLE